MTTGLHIKEVAEASGFTAATLRYYEQIGLLPESVRTPAGYRTYDGRTLERLAFIARAKQLGCTLEEITGLTAAWNGGRCGPIQDQLRRLVARKITTAQAQIGDLMTFTSELQTAATALEQHRPEGACDDDCGCVSTGRTTEVSTTNAVMLSAKPQPSDQAEIACTLPADSINGRLDDWQNLLGRAMRREAIEGGVRVVFAGDVSTGELMRLVSAEHDCCQFFQFAITVDSRGVALDVRAPADALPVIVSLFGAPS